MRRLSGLLLWISMLQTSVFSQWEPVNNGLDCLSVWHLAVSADKSTLFAIPGAGLFASTDGGSSWFRSSIDSASIEAIAVSGTDVYARGRGLFRSSDNGFTWIKMGEDTLGRWITAADGHLFVLRRLLPDKADGVFHTSNNGTTWDFVPLSIVDPISFFSTGTRIYLGFPAFTGYFGAGKAGTLFDNDLYYPGGVSFSSDFGATWAPVGLQDVSIVTHTRIGSDIFMGGYGISTSTSCNPPPPTPGGIYRSSDNDTNWTELISGLANRYVRTLQTDGTNLFAGTDGGVFLLKRGDTTWLPINQGLTDTIITSMTVDNGFLYVGTTNSGVWRRLLADVITSQRTDDELLPTGPMLAQNYPNPFNPTTAITFEVALTSRVDIRIYDMLGREVAVLVDDLKSPGSYQTQWNARGYPSGIYYCRLQAGPFTQTRRLVLVK